MNPLPPVILYAEDDESDAFLFEHAFKQAGIDHYRLVIVPSGKDVIEYLSGQGQYADTLRYPLPALVLLDLKLPGISGFELLQWIRNSPRARTCVTVMLSSSNLQSDIRRAYAEGANSYLVKPGDIEGIVKMVKAISEYWLIQNRTLHSLE